MTTKLVKNGKPEEIALARYAVIAPLVCREMSRLELWEEIKRVAKVPHRFPNGYRKVSPRSIRRWRQYFLEGRRNCEPGLPALYPKSRKDSGTPRVLPQEIIDRAVALREEMPSRKTRRLIELLTLEAKAAGRPDPQVKESQAERYEVSQFSSSEERSHSQSLEVKDSSFSSFSTPSPQFMLARRLG